MPISHSDMTPFDKGVKLGEMIAALLSSYPDKSIGQILSAAFRDRSRYDGLRRLDDVSDDEFFEILTKIIPSSFVTKISLDYDETPSAPSAFDPGMAFNLPLDQQPTAEELNATVKVLKASGAPPEIYTPYEEQARKVAEAESILEDIARTLSEALWPKSKYDERGEGDKTKFLGVAASVVLKMESLGWKRLRANEPYTVPSVYRFGPLRPESLRKSGF